MQPLHRSNSSKTTTRPSASIVTWRASRLFFFPLDGAFFGGLFVCTFTIFFFSKKFLISPFILKYPKYIVKYFYSQCFQRISFVTFSLIFGESDWSKKSAAFAASSTRSFICIRTTSSPFLAVVIFHSGFQIVQIISLI